MKRAENYFAALEEIKVLVETIRVAERWRGESFGEVYSTKSAPNRLGVVHPDDMGFVIDAIADHGIRLRKIESRE
jgi:hypothetical protein